MIGKMRSYSVLVCVVLLSGCITDATVELSKAPFDATSDITGGTSKAVGELLEPTKKLLSSTTPGAIAIDRLTRAREKTELFVGYSYEHLRAEAAQGTGEHVSSLAVVAGIPADRHRIFKQHLQESYTTLFDDSLPTREVRRQLVDMAWADGFGRQESASIRHEETGIAEIDLQFQRPKSAGSQLSQR